MDKCAKNHRVLGSMRTDMNVGPLVQVNTGLCARRWACMWVISSAALSLKLAKDTEFFFHSSMYIEPQHATTAMTLTMVAAARAKVVYCWSSQRRAIGLSVIHFKQTQRYAWEGTPVDITIAQCRHRQLSRRWLVTANCNCIHLCTGH